MEQDTIAAISTAIANGGIGMIRISGKDAVSVADRVLRLHGGKTLSDMKSHTIHYGHVYDEDEIIDEVMVTLMRGPKSYTREDVIEINCHGGVYVLKKILELVISRGARLAEPGEFTKRAFLNGRIDLSQAESVMEMIQAKNEYALRSSVRQLSGRLSDEIRNIRSELLHETAYIESALDDPEHISLDGYTVPFKEKLEHIRERLQHLLSTSENGRILKEGISTVIVGKPNAGKSSLLNTLLNEERAIVTNIAGTTRDVLEEQLNLSGILLRVTDTAGIRETKNPVEQIGVEKARESMKDADLILYVVDTSTELDENDMEIMKLLDQTPALILLNKSDLAPKVTAQEMEHQLHAFCGSETSFRMISVSAKEGSGMDELEAAVREMFLSCEVKGEDEMYVTNVRHKAALSDALSSVLLVLKSMEDGMPEDVYTIDLMNAYRSLGLILGEEVEEDLVNEIFQSFCMGK